MVKNPISVRPLTLLEVLVVMTLAGLALGLFGIQAKKAWGRHQFRSSCDLVVSRIELAQKIALALQTEVLVRVGDAITLEPQEEKLPHLSKLAGRPHRLKGVVKVRIDEPLLFTPKKGPQGSLTLISNRGETFVLPFNQSEVPNDPPYPESLLAARGGGGTGPR